MTQVPELYRLASQQNIAVLPFPLPENGSMSIMEPNGACAIGMDRSVLDGGIQERMHLGHELGHCITGSFYNIYAAIDCRQRHENQADKWAIQALIPVDRLDDAIAQGEAGTASIMALVGGSPVTVKPKASTPKVAKHVLEDSTAAWQKAADATVADDLYWRLSATVPAGLTAYDTYSVRFVDTMSAGLDPSKVASSMRVYVAAGADGGFDAASTGKDGRAGTEPAQGWADITAQCKVSVEGNAFTVRTGDLIAALGGADAFTAGARVVAFYNAPLGANCNRGATKGNPNEVCLRYPRSPFADQSGDAGFTRTPSDDATAYTWGLSLIKRSSSDDSPLAGAKLRIVDDRGRALSADGTWSTDADACIVTDKGGCVELNGVDAGVYTVEEVAAPKGYTAFEGKRTVTVTAEGLDVKQVAAAKPKVTVSAESPLRVDAADAGTGSIELSVLNTPSKEASRGFMPSTGDRTLVLVAVLAAIGVAAIVVALVIKRGGGRRGK